MINIKEDEKLNILNHSCAHMMAQAIKHLYPEAKFWVGPVIDSGFYYDVDLNGKVITEEVIEDGIINLKVNNEIVIEEREKEEWIYLYV